MVIYLEHTIGLMFQIASKKSEDAMMQVQQLIESGTIKETKDGYKYLVIDDNKKVNESRI
jgi:hypothetical protein